MNNWTGPEKITAIRLHPYGMALLRKNAGKLFLLTLIIMTLSLINSPVNSQVNIDDGLVQAAYKGEFRKVRSLIAKGVDINQIDHKGRTALYTSSAQGHLDIVEILLSKGADINFQHKRGFNPLMLASLKGHK
ncbi:MAG: ankyrin repeat domain-containing protein, partial [Pelagibacterales bacterium]|nr:ankyrin repeat domain-containing protein [Pelagibacterales bacterium]